jgi:hypothetical protein
MAINHVSIEIWNGIQLLHFVEYIQQYFSYVVAVILMEEARGPGENHRISRNLWYFPHKYSSYLN